MGLYDSIKSLVRSDVPTVQLSDNAQTAIERMLEHGVASILVCDGEKVAGVISDTDLITCIAEGEIASDIILDEVMTPCQMVDEEGTFNPCAQVDENETVVNTLYVFEMSGTHGLVVAANDNPTAGIVCLRDVLGLAVKE